MKIRYVHGSTSKGSRPKWQGGRGPGGSSWQPYKSGITRAGCTFGCFHWMHTIQGCQKRDPNTRNLSSQSKEKQHDLEPISNCKASVSQLPIYLQFALPQDYIDVNQTLGALIMRASLKEFCRAEYGLLVCSSRVTETGGLRLFSSRLSLSLSLFSLPPREHVSLGWMLESNRHCPAWTINVTNTLDGTMWMWGWFESLQAQTKECSRIALP